MYSNLFQCDRSRQSARPIMDRLPPFRLSIAGTLAAYLLCWYALPLGPVQAQQQGGIPGCSQLHLRIRSSHLAVSPGEALVLAAKITNKGARTLTGIGVRIDVPSGLAAEKGLKSAPPLIVNGGTRVFWTTLTLKPGKCRKLKLKARTCGSATVGSFPVGGAVYFMNATDDVICLIPATAKPSSVRGIVDASGMSVAFDDTHPDVHRSTSSPARRRPGDHLA